jgi:hypothetical protein
MSGNKIIILNLFIVLIFSGCIMPEEYLKQTELQETDNVKIIYKGNTVWLEPKHTPNMETYDARIVYKMKKTKGGYGPKRMIHYDSTYNLISSDTRAAITIYKYNLNGRIKKIKFLDKYKELFEPEYLKYAKSKHKYISEGSWITWYYDRNNNPRCGDDGYIVYQTLDTVERQWGDSIIEAYNYVDVYKIDCEGDTIK